MTGKKTKGNTKEHLHQDQPPPKDERRTAHTRIHCVARHCRPLRKQPQIIRRGKQDLGEGLAERQRVQTDSSQQTDSRGEHLRAPHSYGLMVMEAPKWSVEITVRNQDQSRQRD